MKSKLILLSCFSLFTFSCIAVFAGTKHIPSLYSISSSRDTSFTESNASLNDNLRLNEINIHAVRHFRKSFSSITNDKWFKINNGFMATFIYNSIRSQVYYDTRGVFLGMTRCYGENYLPAD